MATYDEICEAIKYAWSSFETTLKEELGKDFNYKEFCNIADSSICKVDDYVMQATDFGVNCPSCGERLDNEDEINSDNTCWHCDNTSDVSVV